MCHVEDQLPASSFDHAHGIIHGDLMEGVGAVHLIPSYGGLLVPKAGPGAALKLIFLRLRGTRPARFLRHSTNRRRISNPDSAEVEDSRSEIHPRDHGVAF